MYVLRLCTRGKLLTRAQTLSFFFYPFNITVTREIINNLFRFCVLSAAKLTYCLGSAILA